MWIYLKKLLREPVVHFALFGVFLFGYFYMVNEPDPGAVRAGEVVVSDNDVARLIEQYKSVWRRVPTEQELGTAIAGYIRGEIMVREALALGLDQGDAAIRNRLLQKMQFLTNSMAQMLEPSDDVLTTYISDNPDLFLSPPKLAFEQVFLGPSTSDQGVANIRTALAQGAEPGTLGQRSMLPVVTPLTPTIKTDAVFGTGFSELLQSGEPGLWVGPVRSGFGYHLVRVGETQPAALLELESNRAKVLGSWQQVQSKLLADAQYTLLRERYDVALPDADRLRGILNQ